MGRLCVCLSALLLSCEGITCTLIGCNSGVQVSVTRSVAGESFVVRVLEAGVELGRFTCPAPAQGCTFQVPEQTPEVVTIEVIVGASTTRVTVSPQYMINRPNGNKCEPTCKQALVSIPV
jgi:hypothetical protein